MRNNRAGSRVGRWGAALLVALALTGASNQAAAAAAQQTATAVAQQTVTPAAHQRASAAAHPTATAVAGSRQSPPRLTKRSRQQHSKRLAPRLSRRPPQSPAAAQQRASATAHRASATAHQPASALAQQTTAATAQQPASTIAQQAATSKAAGGDDFPVIPDPTQPSTQTIEVISPDSPPAQGPLAPGIPELVAALPPFTIQHFPPDVLLNAANPEIAPDAVQVAKGCAASVPETPPLVPLQRDDLQEAQQNVDAAKQGGACLEAIMQEEAKATNTIQVDTLSVVQDRIGIPEDVPVAVNPTIGTPAQEDISAPQEVKDAAQAAQEENKPGEPGEQAEPVFTPLVPDGVGCDAHQDQVLQARASKVSVEAELLVIEYILQQCS